MGLLRPFGKLICLGVPENPIKVGGMQFVMFNKSITGSFICGSNDMKEMLEFSAKNEIKPMIEVIGMEDVESGIEKIEKNQVRYRLVIDMKKGNSKM